MNLLLTVRIAECALGKNKLRAGLTVLGIVIGVAAVITMVSLGQSASTMVQDQLQSLGTNVVVVFPGSQHGGGVRRGAVITLTPDDCDAIVDEIPAVLAASPIVNGNGQVIYGNTNWFPNEILGVSDTYLVVRNWELVRGGFFTARDVNSAAKVCVVGHTIVKELFQTTNPLGKSIRIKNIPFQIIGVLETKGANMVGGDQDNIIMAPHTTVKKRLNGSAFDNIDAIVASARSASRISEAEQEIRALIHERHHIRPGEFDDFTVRNLSELANTLKIITGVMTFLLASIASVSLLVGGVGIMNIMLVSVKERTREIGVRLAVGARGRDILRQFLVEAILLSLVGGVIGVGLGVGASSAITAIINMVTSGTKWPMVISLPAIAVALAVAGSVGMFFGYYPARQASRLDPIDSLRYE